MHFTEVKMDTKNLSKFQKIQLWLSVIPFWSTVFIVFITMGVIKKYKPRSFIEWFKFLLTFFGGFIAAFLFSNYILTGQSQILNIIVQGLILFIANLLFVAQQYKCEQNPDGENGQKNFNKLTYVVLFAIPLVFALIFVGVKISQSLSLHSDYTIVDTNGADTALAVITEDEIINSSRRLTMLAFSENFEGARTSVTGDLADYDYDTSSFSASAISGIRTMQATLTESDSLTLTVMSILEEGNMEIFILVDGAVHSKIPINDEISVTLDDIGGKTVVVRFGAESAKGRVSVTRICPEQ